MGNTLKTRRAWLGGKRDAAQDRFFREALSDGWSMDGTAEAWDACWYTGMPAPEVFDALAPGKTINHIPGNNTLTVKSRLFQTLSSARQRLTEQEGASSNAVTSMDFFPDTYLMPQDYHRLIADAHANPHWRWIRKPRNSARGKGIQVIRDLGSVPLGERWMVQRYLDSPHVFDGHKYVLRLYVLISSVLPLRAYLFEEGSVKLASARYDLNDLGNVYSHLTNPDINATNTESDSPVVFLSHATYREWLRAQGHDDEALFARLRELVTLTIAAARETMLQRTQAIDADTTGCYELLGLDCLVDSDLKPWILECNLSPSLEVCAAPEDGGDVEEHMKRRLVADMVRLLGIDQPDDPSSEVPTQQQLIETAERERSRAGGYIPLIPSCQPATYLRCFPLPRAEDLVLADWAAGQHVERPTTRAERTAEIISEDSLFLYSADTGALHVPNETAAWLWLKAADGHDGDTVADELLAVRRQSGESVSRDSAWQQRREVWQLFADWAVAGMLRQRPGHGPLPSRTRTPATRSRRCAVSTTSRLTINLDGVACNVILPTGPVSEFVGNALESLTGPVADAPTLTVLAARSGFTIASDDAVVREELTLGALPKALLRECITRLVNERDDCLLGGIVVPLPASDRNGPPQAVLMTGDLAVSPAVQLGEAMGTGHLGGFWLPGSADALIRPLALPLSLAREESGDSGAGDGLSWAGVGAERFTRPAHALAGHGYAVTLVLHVVSEETQTSAPVFRDALTALLAVSIAPQGRPPSAEAASRLSAWLMQRQLKRVSPHAVAAMLSRDAPRTGETGQSRTSSR